MSTDHALISRLLTIAGMIMEDASPTMLIADGALSITVRVAGLRKAVKSLTALAKVADLLDQYPDVSEPD